MGEITERWRPVVGYEGLYEVSDQGRVRSLDRIRTSGLPIKGKLLRFGTQKNGYKTVGLCANNRRSTKLVHRLVLEAFVGPCPPGEQTRHGPDPSPANNRLTNLRWGTPKANMRDRARDGKWQAARGERAGHAKRTEKDVEEMFRLRRKGMTHKAIAQHFQISESCISRSLRGLEWSHVYERLARGGASSAKQ